MRFLTVLLLALPLSAFAGCNKNYIGNPHARAVAPRTSSVVERELRVEPANWWTGMKHNRVEVLVHSKGVADFTVKLGKTKGVKLLKVDKGDSPNYVFLTLEIKAKAPAQTVAFQFSKGSDFFTYPFQVLARSASRPRGMNSSDVVYLLFPDRFSNGDPSNDNVPGMYQGLQRDALVGRHGGDLQGVINHLDYLQELGITTLWLNPDLENNQDFESYHGYAVTDHYRVDRRFGTNELLRDLVQKCHARNIKVVRDVVLNHIGNKHYWMNDLPYKDWLNVWPEMTQTTYRAPTLMDPYASEWDKKRFNDGWFVPTMPDLNQRNPHVATYLIQQAIWWIEYAGFDDFRIDTYTYSDQAFCSQWCKAVLDEYPNLGMVGEIMEHAVTVQGFFADDQPMSRANFDSNLPGVIDFQLMFAIHEALNREQGWTEGVMRIYYTLAKDHFYKDPLRNMIMLDNHDFTRFYSTVKEDYNKYMSGMVFLLTMRGVPQIYYATEILGTGEEFPSHGNIRKDFPGGWPGDPVNKFTRQGRTDRENAAFELTKTLIKYRNATPALQTGKLMQFVAENGVYTYFRYDADKTVMVLLNSAKTEKTVNTARFEERMRGFSSARNVITGEVIRDLSTLTVQRNSPLMLELMK
jgi:neopullulanase